MDYITVTDPGASIPFTATAARVAIPPAAGVAPRYVRLAATQACYVRLGDASVTAVAGDLLVQPADAVTLRARDFSHVSAVAVGGGGVLQVSPLAD